MQKYSALFLTLLLCLNIASALRLNPIDSSLLPSRSVRAQLTSMLIQVQQDDTTPKTISRFLVSIQDLVKSLKEEQSKHQEVSDTMMKQCKDEDGFRQKEVNDATDAVTRATAALQKCKESGDASKAERPQIVQAKENYESQSAKALAQRQEENARYVQRREEYNVGIAFVTDFSGYVNSETGAAGFTSFMEKSEHLLRHATKLGLLKEAVPALIAITQIQAPAEDAHSTYTSVRNEEGVAKLKRVLGELNDRMVSDSKANDSAEAALSAAYEKLNEVLAKSIARCDESLAKLDKQIEEMAACETEEGSVSKSGGEKLTRNTNLLNAATKMCAEFSKEFVDATNARSEEVVTVLDIIKIIETRFGKIAETLKSYLESVSSGWLTYQNSTAFKAFIAYEQVHTEGNQAGAALAKQSAF